MQIAALALLLALIFAFLSAGIQNRLRRLLESRPNRIWAVPVLLTGVFALAAEAAGAFRPALAGMVLVYTAAPALCAWLLGAGPAKRPAALDFAAILLLWLPLEFGAGAGLVARPAQGFLHSVAYGIAILLGLILFLCFRRFDGLKYNLPRSWRDLGLALAGFALVAPVLIALGIALGFIPPPHPLARTPAAMAAAFAIIFVGTAIPEEILFRSLIQNLLMQRFGPGWRTLLAASVIFGCAHLDNGPQPLPNWRYMILATIAGVAYGRVFQKSESIFSSAALHTTVDWTKHAFF